MLSISLTVPKIKDILEAIYTDIVEYGSDYFDNGFYLGVIMAALYFFVVYICDHRAPNRSRVGHLFSVLLKMVVVVLLSIYGYAVAGITVLSRTPGTIAVVNLGLMETFSMERQPLIFIVENIIMLMPLGFLLPIVWWPARNFFVCLSIGLFASLTIESAQYILECGMFQTDDLLTNVAGTVFGFVIYKAWGKVFHKLQTKP
ncbi:MAG: VanZ family protein [Lachnospiraceae bacterium]|jgi:hypothetical protein|nr:VanZ family protein [Lachnospiraceae bacterium]